MEHRELSEVVFGLAMEGRIPTSALRPKIFDAPYDRGIEVLVKKGAKREDVAKVLNSRFISDAHDAVHKWNGVGDKENFDWIQALEEAYNLANRLGWKAQVKTLRYQQGVKDPDEIRIKFGTEHLRQMLTL